MGGRHAATTQGFHGHTGSQRAASSEFAVGSMLFVALLHLATPLEPPQVPRLNLYPPRRVALLVEPTPFTHISGYSNRFKEMLRFLKAGGDEPEVITPDDSPDRPSKFLGMPITYVSGFRLPLYSAVQLTIDFGLTAYKRLKFRRPDLIHAVAPGIFVLPSILYARILKIPLVISYHTHLPYYAERYVTIPGLRQFCVGFCNWVRPREVSRRSHRECPSLP